MIKDATRKPGQADYDLFLSYHSSDRGYAKQVYDTLSRAGVSVWFDQVCIAVGESWLRAIERAINEVHTFVVLLSDTAPQRWVDAEVGAAIRRYYPDPDAFRIIPVVLSRPDGRQPSSLGVFLGAFQRTLVEVRGDQVDANGLADLVATVRSSAPPSAAAPKFEGEPYRGLETYLTEHQHLYFGRGSEIAELVDRAAGRTRWLQIEGASGSGKSSLVRAGLIPALSRQYGQRDGDDWYFLTMRPGNNPLKELAVALLKLFPDDQTPGRLSRMEQALSAGTSALTNILREWNQTHSPERPRPALLVVDQFEELFTQYSSADDEDGGVFEDSNVKREPAANEAGWSFDKVDSGEADGDFEIETDQWRRLDVREQFALLLRAALADRDGPLRLVTTIRSDFLHHLAGHKGLATDLNRAERYVVGPLSHEALKQVILQPLRMSGGRMESDELLERLLEDTESGPGRLPLLSHALRALWLRACQREDAEPTLRAADYEAIGGVGGAVTQSADALLANLPPTQRDMARRMFLELVRVGRGTRDVRKTAERESLLRAGQHARSGDAKMVTEVLLQLSGGRLEGGPSTQTGAPRLLVVDEQNQVDVVHDALIDEWETLRNWLNEARRDLERRDDLEAAARAWFNSGRIGADLPGPGLLAYYSQWDTDPPPPTSKTAEDYLQRGHRRQRFQRRLMVAVIVFLAITSAIFSAVGVWGTQQFKIASEQSELAEEFRRKANDNATKAEVSQALGDLRLKQSQAVIAALLSESNVGSEAHDRQLARLSETLDMLARDDPGEAETLRLRTFVHGLVDNLPSDADSLEIKLKRIQNLWESLVHVRYEMAVEQPFDQRALEDVLFLLNSLHYFGHELVARREYALALDVFERNLKLSEPLEERSMHSPAYVELVAVLNLHVGEMLVRLDRANQARPSFESAAETYDRLMAMLDMLPMENVHPDIASRSPGNYGRALLFLRRYDEAETALQNGINRDDPQSEPFQRADDLAMLGLVQLHQGKLAEAMENFQRVLSDEYGLQEYDLDDLAEELRLAVRLTPNLQRADELLELIEKRRKTLSTIPVDSPSAP